MGTSIFTQRTGSKTRDVAVIIPAEEEEECLWKKYYPIIQQLITPDSLRTTENGMGSVRLEEGS